MPSSGRCGKLPAMKNNLTIIILMAVIVLAVSVIDPLFSTRILSTIQSVVMITLGVTAIIYLWRHM